MKQYLIATSFTMSNVPLEYEYTADYVANEPTERQELWKFLDTHRSPNKALIKDNLKNVARMGFQLANEVK